MHIVLWHHRENMALEFEKEEGLNLMWFKAFLHHHQGFHGQRFAFLLCGQGIRIDLTCEL
jgi:hypothetical protein